MPAKTGRSSTSKRSSSPSGRAGTSCTPVRCSCQPSAGRSITHTNETYRSWVCSLAHFESGGGITRQSGERLLLRGRRLLEGCRDHSRTGTNWLLAVLHMAGEVLFNQASGLPPFSSESLFQDGTRSATEEH